MTLVFVTKMEIGKLILERYSSISSDTDTSISPPIRKTIDKEYAHADPIRMILLELYSPDFQFPIMVKRGNSKFFVTTNEDLVFSKTTKNFEGVPCRYLILPDIDPIVLTDQNGKTSYRNFLDECRINPNVHQAILSNHMSQLEEIYQTSFVV